MKATKLILGSICILSTLFTACSSDNPTSTNNALNGADYLVVDAGTLQHNSTKVAGTGKIVFNTPLSSITSKTSFTLAFTLEDGGSLTLIANATNQLANGVEVKFTRSGSAVATTVKVGATEETITGITLNPAATMNIVVDAHNDENPAHYLAWTGTDFAEGAAAWNSEDGIPAVPGNGAGQFWGLSLDKATVTGAQPAAAKFVE